MVVGPGIVSTSPAFMRSSVSYTAGPYDRLAQHCWGPDTICTAVCQTAVTAPLRVVVSFESINFKFIPDIKFVQLYISSVNSPFSDGVGLPLHNIPSPGV